MLRLYRQENARLVPTDLGATGLSVPTETSGVVWIDLLDATEDEDQQIERLLGISIPDRKARGIETRLFHEGGAEYMTMTAVSQLDSDEPAATPVTFVLKGCLLVTIRDADPKPFRTYASRAQKPGAVSCANGEQIMLGLVETLIGRMDEALESVGRDLERLSRGVFRHKTANPGRNFEMTIRHLGAECDLIAMIRESLVSLNRLLAYHTAETPLETPNKDAIVWVADMVQDVVALSDHASYLTNKTHFLLDATLGLINLEQSKIMKLLSLAAVVLLPPTLIAAIFGMNFKNIPSLEWTYGYPWALALIVLAAVGPLLWFRQKGWL